MSTKEFKEILFLQDGITIINHSTILTIQFKDIMYIVTNRPYITIVTKQKEKYFSSKTSIKQLIEKLPECFNVCNQSTIINIDYITAFISIEKETWIHLNSSIKFKVSRRCKNSLRKELSYNTSIQIHNK